MRQRIHGGCMFQDSETLIDLRKRISLTLSEKELLEEEISRLKEQIEQFRIIFITIVEYATSIENDLQKKIELASGSKSFTAENVPLDDIKKRLSLQIDINEDLEKKFKSLQEELEKSRLLFFNTLEHSTYLENSLDQKVDEFSKLAQIDNLTGINNRLKFYKAFHEELEKMKIKRNSLSVIMFDIDHFKQINDVHGHDVGDCVLVSITQITNKIIRKKDTFSRWGGDEFMVLLPETDKVEVRNIAERLRASMSQFPFEKAGHVTCSFGVAHYQYPEDEKEFLKRVDNALYKAKDSGRNKVVFKEIL